jgi:hypothetical protein
MTIIIIIAIIIIIVQDSNRRVREATYGAFGAVALRAQKKLAPHLKAVIAFVYRLFKAIYQPHLKTVDAWSL